MRKILSFIVFLNCTVICNPVTISETLRSETERITFYKQLQGEPFNEVSLMRLITYENIIAPQIALKQAILETGNFSSDLFLSANNIFGMRLARVRETTATGSYNHHASYNHWSDAVKDYKLFQQWYLSRGYDLTDYPAFLLQIGYATDTLYISKLN